MSNTRTRTSGVMAGTTGHNTEIKVGGGGASTTFASQYTGSYAVMTDIVSSNFRKLRDAGEIINTPMTRTETTVKAVELYPTSWQWNKKAGQPAWPNGEVIGFTVDDPIGLRFGRREFPVGSLPSWNETNAGLALAAARNDAAASTSQALVTLGEGRETIGLLRDALDLALGRTKVFKDLQRRYQSGKLGYKDFLQKFSSLWLTYRYGIMPLLYDIQAYVKILTEPPPPTRATERGVFKDEGEVLGTISGSSSMISTIRLNTKLTWKRAYRATCLYESRVDLRSQLGLRLADVPTTLWELTRLSFVADWFANTGDYIGSVTLAGRANVLMQCVVERLTAEYTAVYSESGSVSTSTSVSHCNSDGSGSKLTMVYARTTRVPYSVNDMGSWSPRLALTPKRIVDGFSLLASNLDTKPLNKRRPV